jgi:hypothetical protein
MLRTAFTLLIGLLIAASAAASDRGNRLTYLDAPADPYWVGRDTARLVTPQWIGDAGVEAVIVLAIDDMTDAGRYERYLRPILDRLKQIDGRAPVSIMTKSIDAQTPQLQAWIEEGLSIEPHTDRHPCPCLQGGSLADAKATYDRCVDALAEIPNMQPVAFRMPCCDSMNSVSPRFFREIFNRTTPAGRFLTMDSSVFMLYTPADPALPPELVLDDAGRERFRKYLPTDRLMVNYVEDYPYPFVIGRMCWEIPSLVPSDWVAQHYQGKCNPATVADVKAAIDATVAKQGTVALCFHPHGWIDAEQVVQWVDYAATRYGSKIKFLTFPEIQSRLNEHLLGGHPLRAADGRDNGVRVLDVDADGYLDVVIGNESAQLTRIWQPASGRWTTAALPVALVERGEPGDCDDAGVRFGVLHRSGRASLLVRSDQVAGLWHFDGQAWAEQPDGLHGLETEAPVQTRRGCEKTGLAPSQNGENPGKSAGAKVPVPIFSQPRRASRDAGFRLRDLDGDGICEAILAGPDGSAVFAYADKGWRRLPFSLPDGLRIVDDLGRDAGLRFVDLDQDGLADVVFSNAERYAAYLFHSPDQGFSRKLFDAPRRGQPHELPMIVRADGTDNGAWFSHETMWVQNEDTGGRLPDHVDRRHFRRDFLNAAERP